MAKEYKDILLTGEPGDTVDVTITNAAGNTYDITTKTFTSSVTKVRRIIGSNGTAIVNIYIPTVTSDDTFDISLKGTKGTVLSERTIKEGNKISLKEYPLKTLTWDTRHTTAGYSIASALDTTFKSQPGSRINEIENENQQTGILRDFTLTGAVTKSSALLYVTRDPNIDRANGGDFTNSNWAEYTVTGMNPSTKELRLNSDTNLIDGMTVFGDAIKEHITISKDGSNIVTLTKWPKGLKERDVLFFSMGGWRTNVYAATITGSGTTSLRATVKAGVLISGYADQTILWGLENNVTTVPNASDRTATCVAGATVAIDCGSGDTDANAGSKTYSRVAGPSKGTVGNNSTAFNNNTFTGSSITYNNTSGSAGATDSFTFKCNDGTTDSATKTVTITLT